MYRENLNLKSVIFKIFFTYLIVYLLVIILRYNYDIELLLSNFQYQYLIALNIISIFSGLPLTIIFDFMLIKLFGFYYVLFFTPVLTILGVIQILILRKINLEFFKSITFVKKPEKNFLYKYFKKVTFKSFYILIIRSFPIIPHILGSYIIASSKLKKRVILLYTFLGSFFYYLFLFLIID